jgi:hypothetical protein
MAFMRTLLSSLACGLVLVISSCKDTGNYRDPLPYVYVNEQVFMNELRSLPLTTRDGAYIYITGGLKGIIVYRKGPGQFVALDRQSPGPGGCPVRVAIAQQYVEDSCSNSQFDFNGYLLTGSAGANLRSYNLSYDGIKIVITN